MNGVTLTPGKEMIVGPTTDVIAGEKMIVTAGGVDTHIHFICPQQCDEAIASGITTMYGGGTGPSAGTSATSKYLCRFCLQCVKEFRCRTVLILNDLLSFSLACTPGPGHVEMMLRATDDLPLNFGFSGKGNTSDSESLKDVLRAGAAGFKCKFFISMYLLTHFESFTDLILFVMLFIFPL